MSNRILDVHIEQRSLDPAAAELLVRVRVERRTETTEIRGRLMGPSCPFASTVEIAYPLRTVARTAETISCRVIIPEPSLWDPQSPFLYGGPVELWQDGQRCDRLVVRHGLRQFQTGSLGLRINSKLLKLNGCAVETLDEETARRLRTEGHNLLVVPLRQETVEVWEAAERWGFLVLGQVEDGEQTREWKERLELRASCMGWLNPGEDWQGQYGS